MGAKPVAARGLLWLCVLLITALPAWPATPTDPQALIQRAETLQKTVDGSATLSDDQKAQTSARLGEISGLAREIAEDRQALTTLNKLLEQAQQRLEELREQQAKVQVPESVDTLANASTERLESALSSQRTEVAALQLAQDDREKRLSQLSTQAREDAGDLATLQERLEKIDATDVPAVGDPVQQVDALWQGARAEQALARIELITLRQSNIDILTELARRERDVAAARTDAAKQRQQMLLEALQARRQQETEAVISAAEGGSVQASGLRVAQSAIATLAREQTRLLAQEAEWQRRLEQVKRTSERLNRDYDRIRQIVELGGSSSQVSLLLQKRRETAPSPERLNLETLTLQQALGDAGLRQVELDEKLQELIDVDATLAFLIDTLDIDPATVDAEGLRNLAGIYRQTALELWQGYTRYLAVLSQLEANTRSLALEARRYQGFINDRLLWVPSSELIPLTEVGLLLEGPRWLVDQRNLQVLWKDVVQVPRLLTGRSLFWLFGALVLWTLRRRALAALARAAAQTQKVRTDRFSATLSALVATLILIISAPWIVLGAGLLLGSLPNAANSSLLYAAGLQAAGQVMLFLGVFRHLCRRKGLALAHLHWHPTLCESLGRQAKWLMPITVPLGFLVSAGSASVPSDFIRLASAVQIESAGVVALGRLAFTAQMVVLVVAIYRIWRKPGAVMTAFAASSAHGKWANYHILWFGPSLLLPLLLAGFALLGYFYTAVFMLSIAGETLWIILFAILGKDLLLRGLYVTQRRLRFDEAVRRRDELIAQRSADIEGTKAPEEKAVEAIEGEKVDYRELGDQVRSLVQLGFTISILASLWWIWSDTFPGVSFLDNIELPITTSKLVDGVTKAVPLTLGDMVAGLLLGGLALFAAMKVPAVLELTLLQRLPMSRASRYAFTTLLQYVVATIGIVITFNALGLQWSNIQWLVAALSVGLGFGLQEIVANFISGIILLFEQPIRVGDVVTVEGTTGTVSKIRIRATTIVNYDRQELVIPNKSFITGQLINWTLSDTVNRVLITVGVSYGTDTRMAMDLVREAAKEHHNVLEDPAPLITFEGFGDNALTLNLRAYLANLDNRLLTITELHQAILDKFREAGIEIAFPQRDVHLSTTAPLEVRLQQERMASGGEGQA